MTNDDADTIGRAAMGRGRWFVWILPSGRKLRWIRRRDGLLFYGR